MAERKERVQLEPEGSIRVGSVRTFLTEMERFEQFIRVYRHLSIDASAVAVGAPGTASVVSFNLD